MAGRSRKRDARQEAGEAQKEIPQDLIPEFAGPDLPMPDFPDDPGGLPEPPDLWPDEDPGQPVPDELLGQAGQGQNMAPVMDPVKASPAGVAATADPDSSARSGLPGQVAIQPQGNYDEIATAAATGQIMPRAKEGGAARRRKSRDAKVQKAEEDIVRRVPPHSHDAEQAVLAGLMLRRSDELMTNIADELSANDFYNPSHSVIFEACFELFRRSAPVELTSVAEHLANNGKLEQAGGMGYLVELTKASVAAANAEYYANIVRNRSLQRRLIEACSGIISSSYDSARDVPTMLEEAEQAVFAIAQRTAGREFVSAKELLDKVFGDLSRLADSNETVTGVATGFSQLDKITSGLQPSDLIIVAARPSMGKTAFAVSLALNAAIRRDVPVAFFSLEMSREQVVQRMLAAWGKVDLGKMRRPGMLTDEDWKSLWDAASRISEAPIYIDDTSELNTLQIRARARRLKAEKGLGMVVVDYLQLMRGVIRSDSREQEVSEISRTLKALAKELNVPVVALAQLNRKVDDRGKQEKRPILSDLRESGAIEQDADVIMFVYREDVYKYPKASDRPKVGVAEIIVGKHRNGPTGDAQMIYNAPYTLFQDMTPDFWNTLQAEGGAEAGPAE